MISKFKVACVGGGMVGSAVASYYGPEVKIYDKYKESDSIEEVAKADFVFIAVPTPFNNGFDAKEMDDAIENLVKYLVDPERQVVILKSTIVPGTTNDYQQKYPHVNFIFNPEFLTESTAAQDFAYPDKQLVGYTEKTKNLAEKVLDILPDAPYKKIFPAKVCEMAKYAVNAYYAFKVIFGNQIYDLCKKLGIDYNLVRQGLVADSRIMDSHFDVMHGGYRGFDGKCLPKDVKTLVWLAKNHNVDVGFIEEIIRINNKLTNNL